MVTALTKQSTWICHLQFNIMKSCAIYLPAVKTQHHFSESLAVDKHPVIRQTQTVGCSRKWLPYNLRKCQVHELQGKMGELHQTKGHKKIMAAKNNMWFWSRSFTTKGILEIMLKLSRHEEVVSVNVKSLLLMAILWLWGMKSLFTENITEVYGCYETLCQQLILSDLGECFLYFICNLFMSLPFLNQKY